jgi:ketosteroid isomerase-like protein
MVVEAHEGPDVPEEAVSNIDTVNAIYAAFGRGDVPAILSHLADEVAWEDGAVDHGVPWLRPGTGKAHVEAFFGIAGGSFDFKRFEVSHVLDGGDVVVALLQVEAMIRDTGKGIDNLEVHVWRFGPDGKVAAFNHVVDTHQHVLAASS